MTGSGGRERGIFIFIFGNFGNHMVVTTSRNGYDNAEVLIAFERSTILGRKSNKIFHNKNHANISMM